MTPITPSAHSLRISSLQLVMSMASSVPSAPLSLLVDVAQQNGSGSLLEWIVCICPDPASLAFRLGTVISFGLGRGNPSRAETELVGRT